MAETTITNLFNGRPVNPKIDSKIDETRQRTRRAVLRSDIKSAREMNQANSAVAKQPPQALGIMATKIMRDFTSGKIDMKI